MDDHHRRKAVQEALREFKPRYKPSADVENFFTAFENYVERQFSTAEQQKAIMLPFLQACMDEVPNVAQWFKNTVREAQASYGDNWDLKALKA